MKFCSPFFVVFATLIFSQFSAAADPAVNFVQLKYCFQATNVQIKDAKKLKYSPNTNFIGDLQITAGASQSYQFNALLLALRLPSGDVDLKVIQPSGRNRDLSGQVYRFTRQDLADSCDRSTVQNIAAHYTCTDGSPCASSLLGVRMEKMAENIYKTCPTKIIPTSGKNLTAQRPTETLSASDSEKAVVHAVSQRLMFLADHYFPLPIALDFNSASRTNYLDAVKPGGYCRQVMKTVSPEIEQSSQMLFCKLSPQDPSCASHDPTADPTVETEA